MALGGHYLGGKSATGLMEWADVESALEVYVVANHYTMHSLSNGILSVVFLCA